jgi:hypothetical protein
MDRACLRAESGAFKLIFLSHFFHIKNGVFIFLITADEVRTMMRDTLQHLAPSTSASVSAPPLPPRPSALAASSATKLRFLTG